MKDNNDFKRNFTKQHPLAKSDDTRLSGKYQHALLQYVTSDGCVNVTLSPLSTSAGSSGLSFPVEAVHLSGGWNDLG